MKFMALVRWKEKRTFTSKMMHLCKWLNENDYVLENIETRRYGEYNYISVRNQDNVYVRVSMNYFMYSNIESVFHLIEIELEKYRD